MKDDRRRYASYKEAWHSAAKLKHWKRVEVQILHEPESVKSNHMGNVYVVYCGNGRYLMDDGSVK